MGKKIELNNFFVFFDFRKDYGFFWRINIISTIAIDSEGGELKLEITDVRVRKIRGDGKMKAVASVTFNNSFVVHDIKVIEGQNGLFIAMPSRKTPTGEYRDIAHPINSDMRGRLQGVILEQYEQILSEEE